MVSALAILNSWPCSTRLTCSSAYWYVGWKNILWTSSRHIVAPLSSPFHLPCYPLDLSVEPAHARQCSKSEFWHCTRLIAALSTPLLLRVISEPSSNHLRGYKPRLRLAYATPTLWYSYDIWHTAHDQRHGGGYGWQVCRRPQRHHSTLLFHKITLKYAKFLQIYELSF